MLKQFSEKELLGKPLSEQQEREIRALMEMREEDIDTSDIPEVQALPSNAIRGSRLSRRAVILGEEPFAYFSAVAARKGVSLTDLVNDILGKEIAVMDVVK